MALYLSWQDYASWLIGIQGLDIIEALQKAGRLYTQQYNKPFETAQAQEIKQFLEERF